MRTLYIIGTGPGSPDLITLRAKKAIEDCSLIFAPDNRGKTMALDTVREFLTTQEVERLYLPMGEVTKEDYQKAADFIEKRWQKGNACLLTIGDAMTYATTIYIREQLSEQIKVEVIPGIPSYIAAFDACQCPMTVKGDNFLLIDEINDQNREALQYVNAVAILKTRRNKEDLLQLLDEHGFETRYLSRVSLEDEEILEDREEILGKADYMSLIIGRKRG